MTTGNHHEGRDDGGDALGHRHAKVHEVSGKVVRRYTNDDHRNKGEQGKTTGRSGGR